MKKILILCLIALSINTQAQFLQSKAPSSFEVELNNAQDIQTLLKMVNVEKLAKNYKNLQKVLEKIVKIKPYIPTLQYQLAGAYALNDDKTPAFNTLIALQKQGFYFDIANNPNFPNINSFPVFDHIKENFDANGQHFGEGKESFFIDKSFSGLLFESLAFDDNSQSFLLGSLRDGSVIKVAEDGEVTALIPAVNGGKNGHWSVIDLAVDAKNDILWVASSAISQFGKLNKEIVGMSGIFKYQLSTGKFIKSFLVPENKRPTVISSMHLTPQGDLYFVDPLKNVVLKLGKDANQISITFKTNKYNNLRNITSDETGKKLYLSDLEEGIIILNLENEETYAITNSPTLNLTNISDLIYDNNGLIIIQSGFQPERIMRLQLESRKLGLANIFPIESANPRFNSPSVGIVVAEGLYYITNSQMPKTNLQGGLISGQQWENMYIYSSYKHYNEQETLDYQKEIDAYKKETGAADKEL
ncbi:MAG: hypothetical protein L3J53_04875 [Proteobacteria bacterium]|nr:hypothetical protein [Pseudomonadota bacterium]